MPSDKCNSIMAIATGLISSLSNVVSSRDMSFHQLKQIQCLHHGYTKAYLCSPFPSPPLQIKQHTHYLIDNWGMYLNDQTNGIFCNSWSHCGDAFHATLCLYHCVIGSKLVNTKCTGTNRFQLITARKTSGYALVIKKANI